MKAIGAIGTGVFAAIAALLIFGTSAKELAPKDDFMAQKSKYCQSVLDGLMNEKFDTIVLAGENMARMKEDKRWRRLITEEYRWQSEDFRMNAQAMVDAALRKDLDKAMEGYIKSLQSCYNCHKYVRSQPRSNPPETK